jgi:hypothetical protein
MLSIAFEASLNACLLWENLLGMSHNALSVKHVG